MPATLTNRAVAAGAETHEVMAAMRTEGLVPRRWSNPPGDTYAPHTHAYHKVLYCIRGSIHFVLTREGTSIEICAGDRLDIDPHTEHSASVGPEGVVCLEASR
jgi:quercetin dioxygenase-like cupin family protein